MIIVDDGSSDNSKSIIKNKYLKIFPKFKLALNSHQGKAFAILTGIKNVKGDWVMFSDIDLATPIEEADKLIKETNNYQIVIGSRSSYRQGAPILRKIMAFGAIIIRNFIIGLPKIRDTQCGFKIFEKEAALKIIDKLLVFHNNRKAKGSSVSAGFDMEFLFLASKLKYDIKEIPVQWRHVETKNVNFIKDAVEGYWLITDIAVAERTETGIRYKEISDQNRYRDDSLGEFLNRPLFVLENLRKE